MNSRFRCIALLLPIAVVACSSSPQQGAEMAVGSSEGAIKGGVDSNPLDYIWRSTVEVTSAVPGAGKCSGVLVGPHHVLTAAHCLVPNGSTVEFFSGAQKSGDTATVVSHVEPTGVDAVNNDFLDSMRRYADIAVLTLDHEVDGTRYTPAQLNDSGDDATGNIGFPVTVAGRGQHDNNASAAGTLRWNTAYISYVDGLDRSIVLTAHATDSGDSGGPLFTISSDFTARLKVLGIEHGTQFKDGTGPTIYSNVGVLRSWIDRYVTGN